ncbi:MAG: FAD-binding protein [SAR202 cluster bacterium]|nr:FAD-binding protein [SAR202 cluster bacterium]
MSAQITMKTNVLVVGSGAVGVAASIEAREAGAKVLVIEQADHLGGAAAISGGGCCLADTPLQRERGIEDSADLAFDDWIRFGEGSADEVWARFYLERSSKDLFEWAANRGVNWVGVNMNEGNSVARWHAPEGGGGGIWHALHDTAVAQGVDTWMTSTAAKEFIVEDGRVVGVRAERGDSGDTVDIMADAVVMGTGGFASNLDMLREHRPDLREHRVLEGSHIGAQGNGHRILGEMGSITTHMDEVWFYVFAIPDHRDPKGRRGLVVRGVPDGIWVNAQGLRFHNEDLTGGASGAPAVMSQDPAYCWSILDSTMTDGISVSDPQYYVPGTSRNDPAKIAKLMEESPSIVSADTLDGLASQIGVPSGAFVDSVARYNSSVDQGLETDPDFGRPLANRRMIERPPYFALNFVPLARKSFGGVKTNLRCQPLDKHYRPIPGVYAAGELAGMAGGHINGKNGLEGTMLGPSLFSGRVAGAWAAKEAGFGAGFTETAAR